MNENEKELLEEDVEEEQDETIEEDDIEYDPEELEIIQENPGVQDIDLNSEMKNSFLSYAMSVIVSRALPDVRDGMKPVHRRILYAMDQIGVYHDKPHKNLRVSLGMLLVNTIHMVILLYMKQWFVWHKILVIVIH